MPEESTPRDQHETPDGWTREEIVAGMDTVGISDHFDEFLGLGSGYRCRRCEHFIPINALDDDDDTCPRCEHSGMNGTVIMGRQDVTAMYPDGWFDDEDEKELVTDGGVEQERRYRVEVGLTKTATVSVRAASESDARSRATELAQDQPERLETVDTFTNSVRQLDAATDGGIPYECFNARCDREFESLDDMVAVDGKGNRSPRHFCEECSERVRRGPPLTDGGQSTSETEHGNHVALVSGGMDSTVAADVAVTDGPADLLVYLDTGTGLRENREYIEDLADALGVQLWTLRTPESYEDRVTKNGFPGPSRHSIMYRSLKERQIGRLATLAGGRGQSSDLHLWTGVRSQESERRMEHVEPEADGPRWVWHAPIHDWTKEDCREYLADRDLPENPLWETLGRSGDCFCGCFGSPEEKLDLRAAGCDDHAEWIEDLEERVDLDEKQERETWAWGAFDDDARRRERVENDDGQLTLCSTCGLRADGGDGVIDG